MEEERDVVHGRAACQIRGVRRGGRYSQLVSGRIAALVLAAAALGLAACGGTTHTTATTAGATGLDRCAFGSVTAPGALPSRTPLAAAGVG